MQARIPSPCYNTWYMYVHSAGYLKKKVSSPIVDRFISSSTIRSKLSVVCTEFLANWQFGNV